jgi:prolyl oligopeptidase
MACLAIPSAATPAPVATTPDRAPVKIVTDTYFGVKVDDPYRYMENLKDPAVVAWIKRQAAHTRATLDGLPGRKALLDRMSELSESKPASVSGLQIVAGDYYTLRTLRGGQMAQLYVRHGLSGTDALLIDPAKSAGASGGHVSLQFYAPSPDNRYVVYGLSSGGSRNPVMHILDRNTGRDTGETIDRAEIASPNWKDGHSFFYTRMRKLGAGESPATRYQNARSYLHVVGSDPEQDPAVLGAGLFPSIAFTPDEMPTVLTSPGTHYAVATISRGVDQDLRVYAAPLDSIDGSKTQWQSIAANYEDGIVDWSAISLDAEQLPAFGNVLYMVSRKNDPKGEVLALDLDKPRGEQPMVIIAAGKSSIQTLRSARDALYVITIDGGVGHTEKVAHRSGAVPVPIALPDWAHADELSTDPNEDGAVQAVTSWIRSSAYLRIDANAQVTDTGMRQTGSQEHPDALEVRTVNVKSWDGTDVPLALVYKKGLPLDGSHMTWLYGYGAYGISQTPYFTPQFTALIERGAVLAVALVRGGGEFGETWHQAGMKLTKPNTWRDLIACADYLIAQKYTSAGKLAVQGDSAGGIMVGRAIEERPDLFAAAFARSPVVDMLRSETMANGAQNIPEFGSVKTQEGFEDLYAMSPYAHVRSGVAYPAVLLEAGFNDPYVEAWQDVKMAARLQAATSGKRPILLRMDFEAGHGSISATKQQALEQTADEMSFAFWQAGDPEFQPKK